MKEFIEKLIGRLEEKKDKLLHDFNTFMDEGKEKLAMLCEVEVEAYSEAISIVKELAEEYKGGWIPCSERLPEDGREVLAYCDNGQCSSISVVTFRKGKTKEELQAMECPCICSADQWGNNLKPYAWFDNGPMQWFGQDVLAWQPLPEPYNSKGE